MPVYTFSHREGLMVDGFMGFYAGSVRTGVLVTAAGPLHFAVMNGHAKTLEWLLNHGADPLLRSKTLFPGIGGYTHYSLPSPNPQDAHLTHCIPWACRESHVQEIHVAALRGNHQLFDFFLARDGLIAPQDKDYGKRAALGWACETWDNGETIRKLLQLGGRPRITGCNYCCAISRCLQAHSFPNVLHILESDYCGQFTAEDIILMLGLILNNYVEADTIAISGNTAACNLLGLICLLLANYYSSGTATEGRKRILRLVLSKSHPKDTRSGVGPDER
ncbi:hypothetical protein OQA88_5786 [Cercophora sp. LCS_1]